MDGNPAEQVINELFPYFEALETRSLAILQFLKDKGLTTDEQFAPYLEQAANASSVKWLAARVRVERLVASALREQKDSGKAEETKAEPQAGKKADESSEDKRTEQSEAKGNQPETGESESKPSENTKPDPTDNDKDKDKPDKRNSQVSRGSDGNDRDEGAERTEKRAKDASPGSDAKEPAKESADKKAK